MEVKRSTINYKSTKVIRLDDYNPPRYQNPALLVIFHQLQEHVHSQQGNLLPEVLHTPAPKRQICTHKIIGRFMFPYYKNLK